MMSYAQSGLAPWVIGALAVTGLWAGVWILLSAIGIRDRGRASLPSVARPGVPVWQQSPVPGGESSRAGAGREDIHRTRPDTQEDDHR